MEQVEEYLMAHNYTRTLAMLRRERMEPLDMSVWTTRPPLRLVVESTVSTASVLAVCTTPNNIIIATVKRTLTRIDHESIGLPFPHAGAVIVLTPHPTQPTVVLSASMDGSLALTDTATCTTLSTWKASPSHAIVSAVFTLDGTFMVAAAGRARRLFVYRQQTPMDYTLTSELSLPSSIECLTPLTPTTILCACRTSPDLYLLNLTTLNIAMLPWADALDTPYKSWSILALAVQDDLIACATDMPNCCILLFHHSVETLHLVCAWYPGGSVELSKIGLVWCRHILVWWNDTTLLQLQIGRDPIPVPNNAVIRCGTTTPTKLLLGSNQLVVYEISDNVS